LQRFQAISITVTPPSDFGVLKNVEAITQQLNAVQAKVIKQHNTAVNMNIKSVHP